MIDDDLVRRAAEERELIVSRYKLASRKSDVSKTDPGHIDRYGFIQ